LRRVLHHSYVLYHSYDEEVPDGAAMRTNSIVKRTIPTRKVLGRINHMVGIGARSVRKGKAGRCL